MPEDRHFLGRSKKKVGAPVPPPKSMLPSDYGDFFQAVKEHIAGERLKALSSANSALILLYWDLGQLILAKQDSEKWGSKVIDRLSHDLKEAFPEMSGFSPRNLKYMRKFADAWPDRAIVQRTIAQIPWSSNLLLLEKVQSPEARLFYAEKTHSNGWSKVVLSHQISTSLHEAQGSLTHNFQTALPPADSDLASQIFKDPYILDFLGTDQIHRESELERNLVSHIESFLLELGQGFAFVGRQVRLEVGGDDFYLDLLFYHLKLRCYVVIELKTGKFEPGHVSQLNMYLNLVDDLMKHPDDKPTIGLLLIKERNRLVAEYALAGYQNPMGIAEWEKKLTQSLPKEFESSLPSIETIEQELEADLASEESQNQL
jgi:predicted nuclease of restriction endonuclease-like (RecB) superfamily